MDPAPEPPALTAAERLQLMTSVSASFQSATQQADGKVGMLLVLHSGAAVMVGTQIGGTATLLRAGGGLRPVLLIVIVAFAVGFLAAGYHLLGALWPRIRPPRGTNRFAFPTVSAGGGFGAANGEQLCAELWSLAEVLAGIAVVKNHRIWLALRWLAVTIGAAVAWILLTTVTRS